ncbi:MAG: metal ABC transporter substrate-binding protein [Methyloceanibacter sp.]|uniref:metal ABC transporter substrate-binding protein n=1 Tax=Methyloceanibacter sp. TaxID=1965321 RepID=UPI003EE1A73C
MFNRLTALIAIAFVAFGVSSAAQAADQAANDKLKAVASFSILGDMVKNVGGDRVEVEMLVGPNGDAHVFSPTPADAKMLADADIFFVNGLGFEGWMERLEKASGFTGALVVTSGGVMPIVMKGGHHHRGAEDEDDHHEHAKDDHDEDHDDHAKGEEGDHHEEHAEAKDHDAHGGDATDPHAWQNLFNGKIYVANIRDALIAADPEGKETYEANAAKYLAAIEAEDEAVRAAIAKLPEARRKIITSHDAFGYFGNAYGLEIIAPEGVSTESEASAQDMAKIIRQIREEHIPAVFLENVTDRRLLDQIVSETGAKIGGVLYSDALSDKDGPAPTYLDMFRHNVGTLTAALSS